MRKSIVFALVFAIAGLSAKAQTEQGDWLVGGMININTAKNNTSIGLTPNAGYFILKNLAVGGNFSLTYTKQSNIKITDFGIGPFARYYFTEAAVRPFVHVSSNFLSTKVSFVDSAGTSSSTHGLEYFLGGGVAYFINENISIEALAGFDHTKYKDADGSGGFNLRIGFQVYLSKNQVDRVRGGIN